MRKFELFLSRPVHFLKKLNLAPSGGAASASGILFSVGTSSDPAASAAANSKFVELRCKSTAANGDNRLLYMHYFLSGGGGGECLRARTVIGVSIGTARGAHISLEFAAAGQITGLGVGADCQLMLPNSGITGTNACVNAEIYSIGSSSSVTGSTTSFFRAVAGGDNTGKATVDASGYLMSIQGLSVGSGKLFQTNTAGDATHALRILIGSTPYYIMLTETGA